MRVQNGGWHLDKRVNISIILALMFQIIAFAFVYGKMEARVVNLEEKASNTIRMPERLARIEAVIERIERAVIRP